MSTWSDQSSAAITDWISKLPPQPSIPSLANSGSSLESKEISTQSRKRKWSNIEQDQGAYFGVEQSEPDYFMGAKPPSRRSSRSISPIRSTLALLRSATPPIEVCQPGPSAPTTPDKAVNKLKGFLLEGYNKAFIPRQLEARLREIAPEEAIALHDAMFADDHGYSTHELGSLWGGIQAIFSEANACSNLFKDENAWVQVVRSVLRLTGTHALSNDLELNSVQSQSVESQYLPTLPSSSTPLSKKADLALVISPPEHSDSKHNQWQKQNPGVGLSHMSDAYTREMLLVCPLEIKRQGGDYNEAVCQLGVWSAAALEKLRILASMGRPNEMLEGFPYPGWTVVGYEWQLHISWKENTGKVIVFGPSQLLSAKVNSYLDIFRLLRLVSKLQQWLLGDYKTWIYEHVLGPR